jgi:hypothetical protein
MKLMVSSFTEICLGAGRKPTPLLFFSISANPLFRYCEYISVCACQNVPICRSLRLAVKLEAYALCFE